MRERALIINEITRTQQERLGTRGAAAHKDWDVELNLPLSWSSNAVQEFGEQSIAPGPPKADWHVTPDLLVRWSHQFDWVKLSAKVDVGEDRYFHEIAVNQDTVFATLKAEFTDGRSDLFVPYIAYTPEVDYLPFFAHWQYTLQDFYGGFTSGIGVRHGRLVRFRDAVEPGDWSFLLDLAAGQRLASPKGFENTFFIAGLDIIYVAAPKLSFWLSPRYRLRLYPDFFGEHRRDTRISGVLKAVWTPDWLRRLARDSELDFSVAWYKNYSNLEFERYTVWEVGPTLFLAWHF
ncbi:MAG TPA: hypothetical protein VJ779_13625 [Acetobacteraceae bacterium]|nr:hypothetical protein [Acetobacteraceae bacterium]